MSYLYKKKDFCKKLDQKAEALPKLAEIQLFGSSFFAKKA